MTDAELDDLFIRAENNASSNGYRWIMQIELETLRKIINQAKENNQLRDEIKRLRNGDLT